MEDKKAFKILTEGLEMANKNGIYSLADSTVIYQALQVIGKSLIINENKKEVVPEVAVRQVTKEKK